MKLGNETPKRIVHTLGSLGVGGTETWLVAVLSRIAGDPRMRHEVVVKQSATSGDYEDRLQALDVPVTLIPRNIFWPVRFYRHLRAGHRADVVHSHQDAFGAFVVFIAWLARVPVRIVQNHSSTRPNEGLALSTYRTICHWMIRFFATDRIAVSEDSRKSLFGDDPSQSRVMHCGVDLHRYGFDAADRIRIREELGIGTDSPMLINVGRLDDGKNHRFLLEIASTLTHGPLPNLHVVIAGNGPSLPALLQLALDLGIEDRVHLLGVRSDVPALLSAADVFVFPSTYEGLGLAAVEAQAAGLPVVMSDSVPAEAVVVQLLCQRLSLNDPVAEWADAIVHAVDVDKPRSVEIRQFASFDIEQNVGYILATYGFESGGDSSV